MWNCLCDCGKYTKVSTVHLRNGGVRSCGCFPYRKLTSLVGKKFNRLTVISFSHRDNKNKPHWECLCDCGNTHVLSGANLSSGQTRSCGCLLHEHSIKTKHGFAVNNIISKEIRSWASMKQRCYNKKSPDYKRYGGRGITVCERWLNSFENFIADMGLRPSIKHTLDRFPNVNGNYEPSNCRWATPKQQGENKRNNVIYNYKGRNINQADLAKELKTFPANLISMMKRKSFKETISFYEKRNKIWGL